MTATSGPPSLRIMQFENFARQVFVDAELAPGFARGVHPLRMIIVKRGMSDYCQTADAILIGSATQSARQKSAR
jgi:hypothetical protein